MIDFERYFLVKEGVKHMDHPFDLHNINTGRQLIKLFDRTVSHITRKSAATKLDGVQLPIRVINRDGHPEFVIDRGTKGEIDFNGVTLNRLEERFPAKIQIVNGKPADMQHPMVKAGQTLLGILKAALDDTSFNVTQEIDKLGLITTTHPGDVNNKKPIRYLNVEYVNKSGTNVIKYGKSFIAFHGVNEFHWEEVYNKKRKTTRHDRSTREVVRKDGTAGYNMRAFERFVDKIRHYAEKVMDDTDSSFTAYGIIPVQWIRQPNFENTLATSIDIAYSPDTQITRSLYEWLINARNPHNAKIKFNGNIVGAMEKKVYQYVISNLQNGKWVSEGSLSEAFDSEEDMQLAVNASVFWHATRLLGAEIIDSLETLEGKHIPVGEGVVIRGMKPYNIPFKITGEFIISNLAAGIGVK